MTLRLVSAVSGVRLRIVSIEVAEIRMVLPPVLGDDVVVVQITVLRDVARHPVARAAEH